MLAAANRDPDAFPEPDRVRVDRTGARSVTYGHGAHLCFGAPLARQEAQLTIAALVGRYRELTPLPGRVWRQNGNLRGLATLPVQLTHRVPVASTVAVGAR
jgi:cytochrome P450